MKVTIHCSDSPFGNAAMIDGWHAERGFKNMYGVHIGYHVVILNGRITSDSFHPWFDGNIESGRGFNDDATISANERGAHAYGFNKDHFSICLVGNSGEFTQNELISLETRVLPIFKEMASKAGEILEIDQHSDLDNKKPFCAGLSKQYIEYLNDIFA